MGKYDDQKLPAIGLLKAGSSTRDVARELSLPYSTVSTWAKEVAEIQSSIDLETIMKVDVKGEVMHDISDAVQQKFNEMIDDSAVVVGELLDDISGMQLLSQELQKTGTVLTNKLHAAAMVCTDPKDLNTLVDALTKLQVAFFAKSATVNVQQNFGASSQTVSKYKSLARPA